MTKVERNRSANWLSWKHLPESENFSIAEPFQREMLIRISVIMDYDKDLSFNKAINRLPNTFYGEIHSEGLKFTDISERVAGYLDTNPGLVGYFAENVELKNITLSGEVKKSIPSFESFVKAR
ncbi:MAG: hypothetical protein ACC618_02445 [Patescibacteria group bacterium]